MPAATVIPALIAYIKVVAVKKLVVGREKRQVRTYGSALGRSASGAKLRPWDSAWKPLRQNPGWMTDDTAYGLHRDGHQCFSRELFSARSRAGPEYGPVQMELGRVST